MKLISILAVFATLVCGSFQLPSVPTDLANLFKNDEPTILSSNQPTYCPLQLDRFSCDSNVRYSQIDGSCNNLDQPWLGKSDSYYKRYLPSDYDDGKGTPRNRSQSGGYLPNPRNVSLAVSKNDNTKFEVNFTHMLASFGQFLTHDITDFAISSDKKGNELECPCGFKSSECFSFKMPPKDKMNLTCSGFARGASAADLTGCKFAKREHLNRLTSFIDATQVYGMNLERSNSLRSFDGGLLKTSKGVSSKKNYLPLSKSDICSAKDETKKCFVAGDDRTSENLGLVGLQTLFLREHNRIATKLWLKNPSWNDQKLFQETRKIVVAIMQNIVYGQWVPTVLGQDYASQAGVSVNENNSYYNGYDSDVSPALSDDFSTAAFRFGHSLVRNQIHRFNQYGKRINLTTLNLTQIISIVDEAYDAKEGGIESILLGLVNEPSAKFDTDFADALQNKLVDTVEPTGTSTPFDLVATNINRGRDHGIPPYTEYIKKCGFGTVKSFQDLSSLMSQKSIDLLKSVYENVNDIDLYIGGLAEYQVSNGVVGPTFACIIAKQFYDLKKGDRFYFENGPSKVSFTLNQIKEIKKATLSKLICNDVTVDSIQLNTFLMPSTSNKKVKCDSLPDIDFSQWS